MKNKEELLKSQGKLNPSDIEEIQWIIEELGNLIEKEEVSENGLIRLENTTSSLISIKRVYTQRVLNMLKQGHMLD